MADVVGDMTERLLVDAGITFGMRVLDQVAAAAMSRSYSQNGLAKPDTLSVSTGTYSRWPQQERASVSLDLPT